MDNLIPKLLWSFIGVHFLLTNCIAQDSQPSSSGSRRRLPTVIITREHLRQKPALYGSYGDVAAEFVVSAGLDTGKSSAVRIRRLGSNKSNATHSTSPNKNNNNRLSHTNRQPNPANPNQHHRPVVVDASVRYRSPTPYPPTIDRRDYLNEDRQVLRGDIFPQEQRHGLGGYFNRPATAYRPPIFVPYSQRHQGPNVRLGNNGKENGASPNNFHAQQHPRTPDVRNQLPGNSNGQHYSSHQNGMKSDEQDNPIRGSHTSSALNHEMDDVNQSRSVSSDGGNKDNEYRPSLISPDVNKTIIAETPTLRLNVPNKKHEFYNRIIRKPSFILKDQITVNELARRSDRPAFGPRSLDVDSQETVRRKRQTSSYIFSEENTDEIPRNRRFEVNFDDSNSEENENRGFNSSKISVYGSENIELPPHQTNTLNSKNQENVTSSNNQFNDDILEYHVPNIMVNNHGETSSYSVDASKERQQYGGYDTDNGGSTDGDVMSFSDFLMSPAADKIRLQRQFLFRNSSLPNDNHTAESSRAISGHNFQSFIKNTTIPLLRKLIAARLLNNMLNFGNLSNSSTVVQSSGIQQATVRSSDTHAAEQRQFGIVVSPFDSHEALSSKSAMPIIRILRGKIIPLPDLPQELIPIILGTYKPSYTTTRAPYSEDPTENMLDNAIYALLQNEEIGNTRPLSPVYSPLGHKANRKSPSTNYIGSLKSSEPMPKPSYSYKPNDWSMGPRCDRLTEEICLDDSDYPSSAIMSSIYKDKAKFDLMYAEVKVRESQVEGLSRKQEQAYSFDHYYGSYSHTSGSSMVPKDYGPNGGFVCPSEVHYGRPHRAKNRKGEWKVVVNVGEYTQTLRMEKCLASGNPCKYVVSRMQSTCAQVYSYHRLLVFNKENGLHIDVFRVPTGCACHLRPMPTNYISKYSAPPPYHQRPKPYEEFGGHVETAPAPQHAEDSDDENQEKKKNSFSSTLWAILGGGKQASQLAQQPQFLDEVQKQITWTQQLKQFPQLLKQISPNQVLKQLLEDDEEDYSIRRQRIRHQPSERLPSGGYATQSVPVAVPLPPPPPPPPQIIARRPVVSAVPIDTRPIFKLPPEGHAKVITVSTSEPTKIFSLTKEGPTEVIRITSSEGDQRLRIGTTPSRSSFKIRPGMYSLNSGEQMHVSEASLVPVAPQFSDDGNSDGNFK
ncbi:hypothetical protein X975_18153, partial [Stegodyphus mimosarum]